MKADATNRIPGASSARTPVFAYLLMTHRDLEQVEALADRILELSPRAHLVVHHDLKAGEVPWHDLPPARAHLVDRIDVDWGGWSIVEATQRMIRYAVDELHAEWVVLASGEHWPMVDLETWERTVRQSGVDALLPAVRLPRRLRFGGGDPDGNRFLARCVHRWVKIRRPRSALAHRAIAGLSKVSLLAHPLFKLEFSLRNDAWFLGLPRRRARVRGWDLFKGSQWFACNARAARIVLDTDPEVSRWFAGSHIPDESYVHTVLHHSPDLVLDDSLVTWVPPEPEVPTAGWMLLKITDLPAVAQASVAFARKVDPKRNLDVIAAIDAEVDRRRPSVGRPDDEQMKPLDATTSGSRT